MAIYFFIGAALFSIAPLMVLYKLNVEKVKNDPDNFNHIQKRFFISVTVSKILPALLLILGITQMETVMLEQLVIPWLIILVALIYGVYYVLSFKKLPIEGKSKEAVNTLSTLTIPFIFSIPIMAALFLFLMYI